ncbi:MAG: phage shock protein operon transcriptional activator [Wenzhouxiangellaceae bacterium]
MTRPEQTLIGESPVFSQVLEQVSQLAALDRPALIIGERGTGKELIAQRLHYLSSRWDKPLITLDCAALPETLLESELFGHEAGAFTGASRRRPGRFELAHQGSLFLDELANTNASVQEKLLRVIEYGRFERLGGHQSVNVDVRLIGATNEDLPTLARKGRFRADLLDRLAFDVITLPPLRARREDIMPLAEHFAMRMAAELKRDYFAGFSPEARRQLLTYAWPGNVRELKNTVERAVYRQEDLDEAVAAIVFDPFDSPWRPRPASAAAETSATETSNGEPATDTMQAAGDPLPTLPLDLKSYLADHEVAIINQALEQARHNQRKAAELLELSYDQLRGLLRKYELTGKD